MSIKAVGEVFALDLKPMLKWLLVCIADNANPFGKDCYPSVATLATKTGLSERSVQRGIADLEKLKLIKRVDMKRPPWVGFELLFLGEELPLAPKVNTFDCPKELRLEVIEIFGYECQYCHISGTAELGPDGQKWHVARIIPGSRGGSYAPENITLSCGTCNRKKRAKLVEPRPDSLTDRGANLAPTHGGAICDSVGCQPGPIGVPTLAPKPSLTVQEPNTLADSQSGMFPGMNGVDAIARVFQHFVEVTDRHPRMYTLTTPKERMGRARFRDCLEMTGGDPAKAEQMMMLVVDTLAESDFHNARGKHKGQPKYNEWKHIFVSTDKLQEWIERSRQ